MFRALVACIGPEVEGLVAHIVEDIHMPVVDPWPYPLDNMLMPLSISTVSMAMIPPPRNPFLFFQLPNLFFVFSFLLFSSLQFSAFYLIFIYLFIIPTPSMPSLFFRFQDVTTIVINE
ncbi:uncharacterized protein DS421_16g542510 [Arachis hypogaea]|nr:uncharacterized protein DS421_16g542510 [Arachis hypogaea]